MSHLTTILDEIEQNATPVDRIDYYPNALSNDVSKNILSLLIQDFDREYGIPPTKTP